jgi:hypothetical protein
MSSRISPDMLQYLQIIKMKRGHSEDGEVASETARAQKE